MNKMGLPETLRSSPYCRKVNTHITRFEACSVLTARSDPHGR